MQQHLLLNFATKFLKIIIAISTAIL